MFLLDTSFIIDLLRGDEKVLEIIPYLKNPVLTSISLFELLSYPKLKSEEEAIIRRLFSTYNVYSFDEASAFESSKIAKRLQKMGKNVNAVDIMIAGIGLSKGVSKIVTADKDFEVIGMVSDLEIILYK